MRIRKLCVTGIAFVSIWIGTVQAAGDAFVADTKTGCKVFKPNTTQKETVTWSGLCKNGLADGPGIAEWINGGVVSIKFEGSFKGGRIEGTGIMIAAGGDHYEGQYKEGKRHGHGVYVSANGERYEGEYLNNVRHGRGALTDPQGNRIESDFRDGVIVPQKQSVATQDAATTSPNADLVSGDSPITPRPPEDSVAPSPALNGSRSGNQAYPQPVTSQDQRQQGQISPDQIAQQQRQEKEREQQMLS